MGTGAKLDELGVPKPVFNIPNGCKILAVVHDSKVVLSSVKRYKSQNLFSKDIISQMEMAAEVMR